jgi:uncharacterized membrane protein
MPFTEYVALAGRLMEAGGILVMLLGSLVSVALAVHVRHEGAATVYRSFRQHLGRAILLGLELLVAADIIRTVSEVPTLEKVTVLAVIVLIRTFLSFALEVELEGRWPWRSRAAADPELDGGCAARPGRT